MQVVSGIVRISQRAQYMCNESVERTRQATRRANLRRLIEEAGSAAELSRRTGASSVYLSQIVTGQKTKKGTVRGVGNELAEKLERGMHKPAGWMDADHDGTRSAAISNLAPDERALLEAYRQLSEPGRKALREVGYSLVAGCCKHAAVGGKKRQ